MCGICGFVSYSAGFTGQESDIIQAMNRTLFHRGPDAQNTVLFDNVAFGFSRLSIIGLENGMQPICNEDDSIMVICNGEIFNYIELRAQLKDKGHLFRTSSDIEVIVHLYEDHDTGFLNQLNGQFAFALFDKRKKRLFCARDQMGIIPFFYTLTHNTFIFGSEIKAILRHPTVEKDVDMVGLDQVLSFPGLISPRTMFKNIHSLENGHYLLIDEGGRLVKTEYWDLIYPEGEQLENGHPESYYIDRLEALFDASIQLRLRADVPSGFYLSGGLDSSMIAMKIHQFTPGIRNEAFSIDFVNSRLSESVYQKLVARQSNSSLNQKVFFYDDISKRLQHSVYHSECPIKETYNTASLSLSESVREKGIKVILSGEGADELFAGYVGYRFDKIRSINGIQNPSDALEDAIRERVWGDPTFFYEANFRDLTALKKGLYSPQLNASFDQFDCLNHPVVDKNKLRNRGTLGKRSYVDFKLRLVDHLVSDHGDRMALANSVEVRYPFLDKNLVEFSTRIPPDLKLRELTEKYILKKMAGRFVPEAVIEREKFGFVAPGSPYLLQNDVEYVNDILSYNRIKSQGYFDPERVEKLKEMYKQDGFSVNVPFENDLLMPIITFGIFLDTFFP